MTSCGNTPTDRSSRPLDTLSTGSDVTKHGQKSLFSATRVYVRIRPFNDCELRESGGHPPSTVKLAPDGSQITILDPSNNYEPRLTYAFEHCFDSTAAVEGGDQEFVYQHVGLFVLRNVIDGYNGCIFAYGQTGSGKTHTMIGPPFLAACEAQYEGREASVMARTPPAAKNKWSPCKTPSRPEKSMMISETQGSSGMTCVADTNTQCMEGLIPRLARDIFNSLRLKHKMNASHSFRVEFEYYEIYNEKVFDLMTGESNGNKTELHLRHQPTCGAYVEGLVRKHVVEEKELLQWIRRGSAERHTACTKVNDRSSRSHAIVSLHIAQMTLDENENSSRVSSKLNLVDLAGSERTGASGVEGKLFKEATKINLSLTALGRVIDALADLSSGKQGVFCPYRDSNLTWLLMDSLGGNSKTSMVATISPSATHYQETCQTLRYASRAKQIVTRAIINEDPQVRQIKALTAEVSRLQRLLRERPQVVHSNEEVEELQDRVLQLEQDVADRDITIDELRSQLLEKNVAEMKKLSDENSRLQHETKDLRRAKLTVLRLQNELQTVTEETERLRAQLAALEKEKQEQVASRLIIHPEKSPTKAAADSKTGGLELQLGNDTLQTLKRLGINRDNGNYASLVDAITRCAADATEKYDAMLQKNTMLIDSHSWTLRENLKQLESKEWEVLTAMGNKLIASFERAFAKREKMQEEKKTEPSMPLVTPRGTQGKGQTRQNVRESPIAYATLNGMKEQIRIEKERAANSERQRDCLQQQLERITIERDGLWRNCEKQKKETQRLQTRENELNEKLTAKEATLLQAKNDAELMQRNYFGIFKALALLMEERLEAYRCLLTEEASERCSLVDGRHASRLHHERLLLNGKMDEMREEHKKAAAQAAAHVLSLQESVNLLRNDISKQERDLVEFTAHMTSALDAQSEMQLSLFYEKLSLLTNFSERYAATLHKSQGELWDKIARVEHDAETRVRDARSLLEEETAHFNETLQKKEEEIGRVKELHETEMRTQHAAKRLEMEKWNCHTRKYLETVEQHLHAALKSNEDKFDMLLEKINNNYESHIQQMSNQLEETAGTVRDLQAEINAMRNQHLQEICMKKEQHQSEIEMIQLLVQKKDEEAYATQRQLQITYNEKEKELQEVINTTENTRDDALKNVTQSIQLLQAMQRLVETNSSLYNEHIDGKWAIVSKAMESLKAEYSARVANMDQRVAETQRSHGEKLSSLQQEHELTVTKLKKEVSIARAVLQQQRVDEKKETVALRAAHLEQVSSLIRRSCTLFAEHAAGRQSIAQQEETARVEKAVALRQLTMQSLHCEEMHRELVGSHASFAAHCTAEHAAWVEAACEVLSSLGVATRRRMEERRERHVFDCLRLEEKLREILLVWEAGESNMLHAFGDSLLLRAKEIGVITHEVNVATKTLLFGMDYPMECSLPPISNPVMIMMIFLEQYKQCAYEEFAVHCASVEDVRHTLSVSIATETLRHEYELTITALEEHFYQEICALQKENAELKVKLSNLRENLEFQASLDQLEEEISLRNAKQDTQRHTDGSHSGMYGGNEKANAATFRHANTRLGGYLSSFFHLSGTGGNDAAMKGTRIMGNSANGDNEYEREAFPPPHTPPPTARRSPVPTDASHSSLAASPATRVNQVPQSSKKPKRANDLLWTSENSQR
ncbi:kinesin, putative [Trypanosoma cruzi marinkellei]|uniref:Kinesin, putative n=1 Tax=Trypanosoma cruzi marinkellei TaxID=85056 RepID=K2MWD7_TRYCR|nr:kinesin, putative [Trypanosoma cruzi marinkellei]